jgi:hypothetical protein
MAYQATDDLLESPVRFFEVEDSIGSKNLVRRQLTIASDSAIALADMREGYWVQPHPTSLNQYVSIGAAPSANPKADNVQAYVVASLSGSQPDVLESGGVTGLQGVFTGRTKIFNTLDATYAPGDLLTVRLVDIGDGGGAVHPGLAKTGATAANAVAKVEFFDSANGVLHFTATSA